MKRVLIISYFFAPQNVMGAVRASKLAKYLTRMGCEVTVICGEGREPWRTDPTLKKDMAELKDVRIVRELNPLRRYKQRKHTRGGNAAVQGGSKPAAPSSAARKPSLAHRIANAVYLALGVFSDYSFRIRATRELKKLNGEYDAVFSTYAPLSVHEVARAAKKRGLARKWIADFRDEVNVSFRTQKGYMRRLLEAVRREADIITAVSDGLFAHMGPDGRVLNNGFDREDSPAPERGGDGKLRAVYCGSISMGRAGVQARDLTPFFMAMSNMIMRKSLERNELEIVYAGGEGGLLRAQAASAGLGDLVTDLGMVTRERSLALQAGADILLLASVNQDGLTGVLTGKLFEYLMAGKPILCLMSGDLPMSETRRVIEETGAGFCYEEAQADKDAPDMTAWLDCIVAAWKNGAPAPQCSRVEEYSYQKLAGRLAEWMDE